MTSLHRTPRIGSRSPAAVGRRALTHLPLTDPGSPDLRSPSRFIFHVANGQRRLLAVGITWGVLWMVAQSIVPAALGAAVQAATDNDRSAVLRWAGVVLFLGVVQALAGILRHRSAVGNWLTSASRVSQMVARHAAYLGGDLPKQVATGEVVAVSSTDVEKIGHVLDMTLRFAGACVSFVVVALLLLHGSLELGLVVIIGMPLLALCIGPFVKPLERREDVQREKVGKATALSADTVAGLRVLRGIGGEQLFLERFGEASQEVRHAAVNTARVRSVMDALQVALPGLFVVAVTWLGAQLVVSGEIDVGQLVAFYGFTAFLVLPLRTVTEMANHWTAGIVAARRIIRVMSLERALAAPTDPADEPTNNRLVDRSSGVVLEPGSLTALVFDDPGEADRVAERLGGYQPNQVTLGGVPLDALSIEVVRRRVLVQDKDPVILSGTLFSLLDIPATGRVSIEDAVDAACAFDVIESLGDDLESALNSQLPERGRTLSGGQRQRLALTRSLIADPDVLILDEPTSAVDAHTEARVAMGIRAVRAGKTTAVITTSPLVLEHVDTVQVVVDGRVLATGSHRQLLNSEPRYRAVVAREDEAVTR